MILTNEVMGYMKAEKLLEITSGLLERGLDESTTEALVRGMITDKNNQYEYHIWQFKASNSELKDLLYRENDRPQAVSSFIMQELMEESKKIMKDEQEEEIEMINHTTINVPKKYQIMLELVEKDSDGYWAYAREGYIFKGMGCRTAHEDTQNELLKMIRTLEAE